MEGTGPRRLRKKLKMEDYRQVDPPVNADSLQTSLWSRSDGGLIKQATASGQEQGFAITARRKPYVGGAKGIVLVIDIY